MNVPQLVQLVDGGEHLADVKARVLLLEYTRVIEKGAEVASRDVFHREVDVLRILESIQKADEPWCLRGC